MQCSCSQGSTGNFFSISVGFGSGIEKKGRVAGGFRSGRSVEIFVQVYLGTLFHLGYLGILGIPEMLGIPKMSGHLIPDDFQKQTRSGGVSHSRRIPGTCWALHVARKTKEANLYSIWRLR